MTFQIKRKSRDNSLSYFDIKLNRYKVTLGSLPRRLLKILGIIKHKHHIHEQEDWTTQSVRVPQFTHSYSTVVIGTTWASQLALMVKNLSASAGGVRDVGSILGLGRSSGGGNPAFLLGESQGRGAWQATVHRVSKCRTQLKWLNTHTHAGVRVHV